MKHLAMLVLSGALLICSGLATRRRKCIRWVDTDGTVHYSDVPR